MGEGICRLQLQRSIWLLYAKAMAALVSICAARAMGSGRDACTRLPSSSSALSRSRCSCASTRSFAQAPCDQATSGNSATSLIIVLWAARLRSTTSQKGYRPSLSTVRERTSALFSPQRTM